MNNQELQRHILSTYNSLRLGMIIIAGLTPMVVVGWGLLFDVPWQTSISSYYFAPRGNIWQYSTYPTRVLFGGILFAVGSFLYLYKGFSKRENIALNLAGVSAIGVALCPMYLEQGYVPFSNVLHFGFAVVLFACIGYTAIYCHEETLQWVDDPAVQARYRHTYQVIGWFMWLFPITGIVLAYAFDAVERQVFWIEAAGIWAFAAFWLTKTWELQRTEAEAKAMNGSLHSQTGRDRRRSGVPSGAQSGAGTA